MKFLAQNPSPAINFPTLMGKEGIPLPEKLTTLGGIISALIPYLFVFAGLLLFAYLIWGGFSFLTSGGEPKAMEQAKGKVTNAIVGFIIIFVAYWVVQIFEYIFKIQVF